MIRNRRVVLALVLALTVIAGLGIYAGAAASHSHDTAVSAEHQLRRATSSRPNIVVILTDDLSWNLINKRWAPHIVALEHRGDTFNHYFVSDSLCCPSRSTIFTGLFPHDTKVVANLGQDGGYEKFQSEHLDRRTFALALHRDGYRTSMLGKYLNNYGDPNVIANGPIPPGWSDWHVSNSTGYLEYNYVLNDNGKQDSYGGPGRAGGPSGAADAYGVDVLGAYAQRFIARPDKKPFLVEAATFAPHQPYTPAARNANDFPGLTEPRDPSFNAQNINPPTWLGQRKPIGPTQLAKLENDYRKRVQSVEAVDLLLANVERELAARRMTKSTYIVLSSDNGYHIAQHRLTRGKQTAFDTDIRVPLIVAGPGVPHDRIVTQVTQNTDLYPTFLELAGLQPSSTVDGHSLVPLLHSSRKRPIWRTVALVEHSHSGNPNDPDYEAGNAGGNPTTYTAIRISARHFPTLRGPVEAVYVEYKDPEHELEYYDIARDPYEIDNIASRLTRAQRAKLHRVLLALKNCHGTRACWKAAMPR